MKKFAALGLAALFAAPAALAEPSGSWLSEVQQVYKQAMQEKDPGARQAELFQGSAKVGETKTHQIQLTAGKYYTFFAACDHDCNNIDLTLLRDGRTLIADTDPHASPMFGWYARQSGQYTLTLTMPNCIDRVCDYSIQVFEGSQKIL